MWSAATAPHQPAWIPWPSRKPLAGLALSLRVGIVTVAVISLLGAALQVYGIGAVTGFSAGTRSFDSIAAYDDLSFAWSSIELLVALVTGALWMVWQYRAANNAGQGTVRRGPGWHAWSWVIPIISFWFPYQNISDLHRATGARTQWLGLWWALWIVSGVLLRFADGLIAEDSLGFEWLQSGMTMSLVGNLMMVAAAPFAWSIVSKLTAALDAE